MKRASTLLLSFAVFALASHANAAFLNNDTGLPSPDQTITFESETLVPNQQVTTQFQDLGVTFGGAFGNPDLSSSYPNISGNRLGNFQSSGQRGGFLIANFNEALGQVAFSLVTAPGTATFQALLNGNLVESVSMATTFDNSTNFFGFEGIVFDQIKIRVDSPDNALLIDNLQTVAVPEPASSALLLAGLALAGFVARRSGLGASTRPA